MFNFRYVVILGLFLNQACSSIRPKPKSATIDTVVQDLTKTDEENNTHVLVETVTSDDEISKELGSNPDAVIINEEESASSNFLKPLRTNRVNFWINYFAYKQRDRFQRFINNGQKYRDIIEKILAEENVPKELFFVGLIESGYYLSAHSRARAVGPWQFIKATGKRYGLTVTNEIDERRDIEKSTRAAARYFKDLYHIFSSWELSLAAYNAGENGIIRRITRHQMKDYYQLSIHKKLPLETINYVPKVLAAMHVFNHHKKYGLHIPTLKNNIWNYARKIPVEKGQSIQRIANRLDLPLHIIKKLNPDLRLGRTPRYYRGTYQIRIPASVSPSETIAQNTSSAAKVSIYQSRLTAKQKRFQTMMNRLADVELSHEEINQETKKVSVTTSRLRSPSTTQKHNPLVYRVKKGETLHHIAKWFNVPPKKILQANKRVKKKILVGQKISIPHTKRGTYTVKRGDHLYKIAKKFNLSQMALRKLNELNSTKLFPGQKLVVNLE